MNKLSKEKMQQVVLVWLFCAIITGLTWFFGVSAMNGKRAETAGESQKIQDKLDDGAKKKARKTDSKAKLEAVNKDLEQIQNGMAQGELFDWIDSKLNEFITQNLLEVDIPSKTRGEVVEVGILPVTDPYKAVRYSVRGTAYFHDFGKFVSAFENNFPYMRLQNIELSPGGQFDVVSDPEKLTFRMDIVALLKPAEATPAEAKKAKK